MYGGNLYQPTRKTQAQNSSTMITAHDLTLSTQSTRVKSSVGPLLFSGFWRMKLWIQYFSHNRNRVSSLFPKCDILCSA